MKKADYDLNNPLYNQVSGDEIEQFKEQQKELEEQGEEGEQEEKTDIGDDLLSPLANKSAALRMREENEPRVPRSPFPSKTRQLRPGVRIANSMLTLEYEVVEEGVFRPFTTREWVCKCDCGRQCTETYSAIYSGSAYSCGCIKRPRKHRYKLEGMQYGRLIVGEWVTGKGWECVCEKCGDIEYVKSSGLLQAAGETGCPKNTELQAYDVVVRFFGTGEIKKIHAKSMEEARAFAMRHLEVDVRVHGARPKAKW